MQLVRNKVREQRPRGSLAALGHFLAGRRGEGTRGRQWSAERLEQLSSFVEMDKQQSRRKSKGRLACSCGQEKRVGVAEG